jgi:hypothetical protein
MKISSRVGVTVAAVGILASGCLAGVTTAASASTAPYPTVYPGPGTPPPTGPPIPVTGAPDAECTPYVAGDYAHPSGGDVSAHGWWYRNNCPNQKTTVLIGLQEYFSDKTWHDEGPTQDADVWPGGGSANWVPNHLPCQGVAKAGWRSYIIITAPGTGASAYTAARDLNCTYT